MSCTENESGPFVVFLVPAVVGCLTILLVRRWANTQVSGTTSTAISRRRKIIKDPLVKRPLPPLASKMVAPTSKKSVGASKKSASDEDGKRAGRPSRPSPPTASNGVAHVSTDKAPDQPPLPKHIPFPYIPQDGELLFESMTFVFGLVAMGLQFLNLYRTTWWLPGSNTNQAMKFYLIDPHLVAFIVTILFRRLLFSLNVALLQYLLPPKTAQCHGFVAARMFILGVILGALAWCTYFIAYKHSLIKLFYLCYPVIVYFLLFGFQSSPFLEMSNSPTPLLHNCSNDPAQIIAEVDSFRADFNLKLKKIIFNAVVDAYYTSYIPCCFAQSFVYYSEGACGTQAAGALAGAAGRYAAQLLAAPATDPPHRAALHLAALAAPAAPAAPAEEGGGGSSKRPRDTLPPEFAAQKRFYAVFINPSNLQCMFLCMQLSLIILQLILLFSSLQWHHFLALVIMLFINYYTLFKILRDYLISWKVYRAEFMIHDKNGTQPVSN